MVKDIFRILGAASILAGIFLYFSPGTEGDAALVDKNKMLNEEIAELQAKLHKTEEELAHLQTLSSEAELPNQKEENQQQPTQFTLTIENGTSSMDVATILANAGMIEDADAFNTYLTSHDLAKNIQIGEYDIDISMSNEQIAKLITTLIE